MEIIISENHAASSQAACNKIVEIIKEKPDAVLCFAGGDSPLEIFQNLIKMKNNHDIDLSSVHFVSLDEWGGLGYDTKGSTNQTLYDALYTPLGIDLENNVHFFDGKATDLEAEAQRILTIVKDLGGIDISLLGIGMNGHLGFNEPGADLELEAGIIPLDPVTKEVGQKYFDTELDLKVGITLGLKTLLASKHVILIANAEKKAEIIKATVEGEISNEVPSSLVRNHASGYLYIDKDAAKLLGGYHENN